MSVKSGSFKKTSELVDYKRLSDVVKNLVSVKSDFTVVICPSQKMRYSQVALFPLVQRPFLNRTYLGKTNGVIKVPGRDVQHVFITSSKNAIVH